MERKEKERKEKRKKEKERKERRKVTTYGLRHSRNILNRLKY